MIFFCSSYGKLGSIFKKRQFGKDHLLFRHYFLNMVALIEIEEGYGADDYMFYVKKRRGMGLKGWRYETVKRK